MSDGGIMFGSRGVWDGPYRGSHQEASKRKGMSDCVVWRRRGLARKPGVKRMGEAKEIEASQQGDWTG